MQYIMAILVNQNLRVRAGVVGGVGLRVSIFFFVKSYPIWTPFLNGINLNTKTGGK